MTGRNKPIAVLRGEPSHDQIRVIQQYAKLPQHGVIVAVEQRTTGAGRSVLLSPDQIRELRDALTEWLERP